MAIDPNRPVRVPESGQSGTGLSSNRGTCGHNWPDLIGLSVTASLHACFGPFLLRFVELRRERCVHGGTVELHLARAGHCNCPSVCLLLAHVDCLVEISLGSFARHLPSWLGCASEKDEGHRCQTTQHCYLMVAHLLPPTEQILNVAFGPHLSNPRTYGYGRTVAKIPGDAPKSVACLTVHTCPERSGHQLMILAAYPEPGKRGATL